MDRLTPTDRGDAVSLIREDFSRLRGRLFQALEATALPDRQLEAIKGLVRRMTCDSQARLEAMARLQAHGDGD
jgi:hypothetical protein